MSERACPQPRRWRAALSALIDGEPTRTGHEQLTAHLDACPDCAAWYTHARTLSREVRETRLPQPALADTIVWAAEASICGCHTGGPCECIDCHCANCTCGNLSAP